jgi:hypothetical protein
VYRYGAAHEKELNDLRRELALLDKIETSGKLLKGVGRYKVNSVHP